jgi:hypothetical protein
MWSPADIVLGLCSPLPKYPFSDNGLDGGARRSRTADLLNAIQALSQLSYGPIREQWSEISNQNSVGRFLSDY